MPATPTHPIDLSPEPDLHPLYPSIAQISQQISSDSGLDPEQRSQLVAHCLQRACVFGDISIVQYLVSDPQAQTHVDLGLRDDDGVGLISLTIHGFGGDLDRDVEREECVRLLVSQGADLSADKAGWTPLHYAAILAPPTLVSYLMTHGCSPFSLTERKLTPLDIVTAHTMMPGKEDVALLLEEAMRSEGWTGGQMEKRRRVLEQRTKKKGKRKELRQDVGRLLDVNPSWWMKDADQSESDDEDSDEDEGVEEDVYTPGLDYSSMLVFSPSMLPQIFESIIVNYQPKFKDSTPANTLYMLARFAALTCDHTWLEEVIIGATDAIEETFFTRAEDLSCLVFWLYNTTLWLHLLECDSSINEACEMLGSFELIEEVINSVFVFIIRFAERRIDTLIDSTVLAYTPLGSDVDVVQFESEWSLLRAFAGKRKPPPSPSKTATPSSPTNPSRPLSPSQSQPASISATSSRGFSSIRQSLNRARGQSSAQPLASMFHDQPSQPSPVDLTAFLTSLHTLLILSDINPALIAQLWSQVLYWTSCEIFNRVITRKKFICRSRAVQISMNLSVIEEWIDDMGLPAGIRSHLAPVKDLLSWLQCLSSITEFPELVATIQRMKHINPLQMRRAVRDYKYEVNEGRMTEECIQYLTQLQKDWERRRVKLGVEAIREKQRNDRERDDGSVTSSIANDTASIHAPSIAPSNSDTLAANNTVDLLLDKTFDKAHWEPSRPPPALGELLDSRYMLPLLFPSDPRLLAAVPGRQDFFAEGKRFSSQSVSDKASGHSSTSIPWRSRNRTLREVDAGTLKWVDGIRSAARWGRPVANDYVEPSEATQHLDETMDEEDGDMTVRVDAHAPLTRKPSGRPKGRPSMGETTPVEISTDHVRS